MNMYMEMDAHTNTHNTRANHRLAHQDMLS